MYKKKRKKDFMEQSVDANPPPKAHTQKPTQAAGVRQRDRSVKAKKPEEIRNLWKIKNFNFVKTSSNNQIFYQKGSTIQKGRQTENNMEIMTTEKINNEVGKEWFLADDNTLAAKLIYISGIKGFDDYLGEEDQYDLGTVIHIKEKPQGIILRLAKNFSAKETAISYKNLTQVSLQKLDRYSVIKIDTDDQPIYFGLDNYHTSEIVNYFKGLKKIIFDANSKLGIPKEVKEKLESLLIKNTDILPINIDKIIASKTKRFFNYFIDNFIITVLNIPFFINTGIDSQSQSSLVFLIILLFYYLIMESAFRTTIGKLVTNTKVVSDDGSRANDIFLRTICRIIPFEPLSFLFSDKGWHDSISKTIVIDRGLRKIAINNSLAK